MSGALQGSGGGFPLRPSDFKWETGVNMATIMIRGYKVLIDDEDLDYVSSRNWYICQPRKGNVESPIYVRESLNTSSFMHRMITNCPKGMEVDHINGNGLDNRKVNLRICTHHENSLNSKLSRRNTSGFRGVCWDKARKKWIATIGFKGVLRNLGRFDSPELASEAYKSEAKKLFGNFVRAE